MCCCLCAGVGATVAVSAGIGESVNLTLPGVHTAAAAATEASRR